MASQKFIKGAIKRPGALTSAVGGKPSQDLGKVRQLAQTGNPQQKREALLYLNVLKKASGARKAKSKQRPPDEVATAKRLVGEKQKAEAAESAAVETAEAKQKKS